MRKLFSILFCLIILIFCAFVSLNLQNSFFWRQNPVFSLDFAQKEALSKINFPIKITAYLRGNPKFQREIKALITELNEIKKVEFEIKNPENYPLEIKERKINFEGQLWIENASNAEGYAANPSPPAIISALLQLAGAEKAVLAHIVGDGERAAFETQDSWQGAYELLKNSNFIPNEVNLSQSINIPQNTKFAVFAASRGNKNAHWNAAIKTFVEEGGNLIFATDIENRYLPPYLAELSGLEILEGVVVDLQGQALGFADPRVVPAEFPVNNPLTKNLNELPLLAGTLAFKEVKEPQNGWERVAIFRSSAHSWNETSPVYGTIALDGEEQKGPLPVAWLLTKTLPNKQNQKILILGDCDLFTKENIHRGGNADFAKALFANFSEVDAVSGKSAELKDQYIKLKPSTEILIAFFMIFLLPLLILGLGIRIRKRFRKKYS